MLILNKHRDRLPPGARYVGRPTPFGNPFSHLEGTKAQWKVATRHEAVAAYRHWIHQPAQAELRAQMRAELTGAPALVCYCAPLECRAEVIQEILETPDAAATTTLGGSSCRSAKP